jgi:hypothetical protein
MILPAAVVLGISNHFILQYLRSVVAIKTPAKRFLTIVGVWIAPLSLILTEAMVDGIRNTPQIYTHLHRIFAFFAFLGITVFASAVSWILHRSEHTGNYRSWFILFAGFAMVILPYLFGANHPGKIGEWNLLTALSIWYINFYFIMKKETDTL